MDVERGSNAIGYDNAEEYELRHVVGNGGINILESAVLKVFHGWIVFGCEKLGRLL